MADVTSAYSTRPSTPEAIDDIVAQLAGTTPTAILFFCFHEHDGAAISAALRARFPSAEVIGCTTAGEFTDKHYGFGALAAMAFSGAKVRRCAAALARFDADTDTAAGVQTAVRELAAKMGKDVRDLDPARHVGVVLTTGLRGREEDINEALGHAAPLLSFVGGSAGDNFRLERTEAFHNGEASDDAAALMVFELTVPYTIIKTVSFAPTDRKMTITRIEGRVVHEINGKPAVPAYAEAIGIPVEELDHAAYMMHPLGLMIDGEPWVRSPIAALPDGSLMFGCAMLQGTDMYLLKSTDLLRDTGSALDDGARRLGQRPSGALLFNCAHRRIEIEMKKIEPQFSSLLNRYPVAGFGCYGESWVGFMNQTLVGILFG